MNCPDSSRSPDSSGSGEFIGFGGVTDSGCRQRCQTPGQSGESSSSLDSTSCQPPAVDYLLAALLSTLVFAIAHWQGFVNPWAINDDLRQQVFWMQRWADPALYPSDLLNAYAKSYVTAGVVWTYRLATLWTDPFMASKIFTGALFLVQCLTFFQLGRCFRGRAGAWAAVAMIWLMPFFLDNISGGLARGWASPLLALFALAVLNGRQGTTALTAQALFIPYIFLPCATAFMAAKLWHWLRSRCLPVVFAKRWWWCWLLGITVVAWINSSAVLRAGFGPLVWLSQTVGRPEFGPAGRLDLVPLPNPFLDFVYYPFEGIGLFKEFGLVAGIFSLILLAPAVWIGGKAVPWRNIAAKAKPWVWLGIAFLLFYVSARLLAFKLFVPDRYAQYPVNLFYALTLALCLAAAWRRLDFGRTATAGLILAAALLGGLRLHNVALYDYSGEAPLCAAVEAATPREAMLAGHPELMDIVLTFSRRNALATFELAHCWSQGYWDSMRPRLDGLFAAYYAKDKQTVVAFAKHFGVDFLVVKTAHFTPAFLGGKPFFEPFGQEIKDMTRGQTDFAVLDPAVFEHVPLALGAFLIDLRPYR